MALFPLKKDSSIFTLIIFFYTLFAGWFIYTTSFVVNGVRYFILFDDAMISMTYAKNFLNGYGLNWAKYGAPVEGYTHPLWVLLMVVSNFIFKADPIRSLPIQVFSFLCMVVSLFLMKKLLQKYYLVAGSRLWIFPIVLTAFYYPLNYWSLWGMETGLQLMLYLLGIYTLMEIKYDATSDKVSKLYLLAIVLCLCLLLRMDTVIYVAVIFAYLLLVIKKNSELYTYRNLIKFLLIIILPNLLYLAFRIYYFNDILPNTYYLKLTGVALLPRIMRGINVFVIFLLPILTPFVLVQMYALKNIKIIKISILFSVLLVTCLYSIYIGGDSWETEPIGANRFISTIIPLLIILLTLLLQDLSSWINLHLKVLIPYKGFLVVFLCIYMFVAFNILAIIFYNIPSSNIAPVPIARHIEWIYKLREVENFVTDNAVVAVDWAGIPGFFSDFKLADQYGYNDKFMAKIDTPFRINVDRYTSFHPGHMKLDYEYLMRDLKVDIFVQLTTQAYLTSAKYAPLHEKYNYEWYGDYLVKVNSPNINYNVLTELTNPK